MSTRFTLLLVLILFVAASCQTKSNETESNKIKVEAFALKVQTELNKGHLAIFDMHFDKSVFVSRVTNDAYWDEQLEILGKSNYKIDYEKQLLEQMRLGAMFLSGINPKKYFAYDKAKIYKIEDRWHAVFRMYANEALNYHDFLLRIDSNKIWIEDMYITSVGRPLSEIMQEVYIAGIPSANGDKRWNDHKLLMKTKEQLSLQNYDLALANFDSLSAEMKSQKGMKLFRLQISANVPNEEYIRQIEAYEKQYPDDAGTLLLQLDKNFMYGNYPKVLEDLDRLEKMYGADPIVDYLKGNAFFGLDNCKEATEHYQLTTSKKRDWQAPWQNRIECLVKNSQYEEASTLLDTMTSRFNYTPTYAKYLFSDYPNFINSSAYKNWISRFEAIQ